jgi:amino-acid N-acetyltransferase
VADEAVDALLEFARADAGCDPHLADQLVLPMALAAGTSRITTSRVTRHLLTTLAEVQQLLGCPVEIRGEEGAPGSVTVEGCGASPEPRAIPHSATRCSVSNGFPGIPQSENAECRVPSADQPAPRAVQPAADPQANPQSAIRNPQSDAGSSSPHSASRIPPADRSPVPRSPDLPVGSSIRKALASDVPGMQRLLAHFASRGDVLPRTLNEMYQHLRDFFVWEDQGEVLGIVALFLYWEDLAEVRSLAVAETAGGRGIGSALVRACLDEARALGVRRVFALTNRPGFFERLGFQEVDKRELPQKIWKDCIRCAKFAACDETALIREA